MKCLLMAIVLLPVFAQAKTPKLNITLQHNSPAEQKRKEQIERLADKYDLAKYTITRDIVVDQQAINHSAPVLTQNLRFLDNDDRALSAYVHEQAHWLLMERHRGEAREMLPESIRMYPNIEIAPPYGDGNQGTSYIHLVVLMLEWRGLEDRRRTRTRGDGVQAAGSLQSALCNGNGKSAADGKVLEALQREMVSQSPGGH